MTNEPSPRPWRVADYAQCPGLADVFDASGSPSGLVAGELKHADAALIVAAVNERDRIRDIVRTFADVTHSLIANYEHRYRDDANSMAYVANVRELIREARAAIGEDNP